LISGVEMIDELIALARRPSRASKPWRVTGLSEEEVAFYDALAQNERAIQGIGNDNCVRLSTSCLNSSLPMLRLIGTSAKGQGPDVRES
jgi:hypothetical protein